MLSVSPRENWSLFKPFQNLQPNSAYTIRGTERWSSRNPEAENAFLVGGTGAIIAEKSDHSILWSMSPGVLILRTYYRLFAAAYNIRLTVGHAKQKYILGCYLCYYLCYYLCGKLSEKDWQGMPVGLSPTSLDHSSPFLLSSLCHYINFRRSHSIRTELLAELLLTLGVSFLPADRPFRLCWLWRPVGQDEVKSRRGRKFHAVGHPHTGNCLFPKGIAVVREHSGHPFSVRRAKKCKKPAVVGGVLAGAGIRTSTKTICQ